MGCLVGVEHERRRKNVDRYTVDSRYFHVLETRMSVLGGGGRIQMRRIYAILNAVKEGPYPNCRTLAENLEYSQKTIQRDIIFMQDQLGIPISYNASMHGYELNGGGEDFPVFEAQVEDLAALCLMYQAMQSVQGTKLSEVFRPSFDRLIRQFDGRFNMTLEDLDGLFSVKASGHLQVDLTLFGKLAEAVLHGREITFNYRKSAGKKADKRRLRPYHIVEMNGGWYVIGHDIDRDSLRTFAMQRVKGLKLRKATFTKPEDFHIGDYTDGSIGVRNHNGNDAVEVVIHVRGWMARIVQERQWHHSHKIKVLDEHGEKAELRMKLRDMAELKRLLLGWGRYAEVVEPKELRDAVKDEAAEVMKIYE